MSGGEKASSGHADKRLEPHPGSSTFIGTKKIKRSSRQEDGAPTTETKKYNTPAGLLIIGLPISLSLRYGPGEMDKLEGRLAEIEERYRQLDAENARQRTLFTALLDQTPSVVWVRDLEGRFLFANRAFEAAHGLHRDQLLGRTMIDVFPTREAELETDLDRQILESKRTHHSEQHRSLNGAPRRYESHRFPLFADNGGVEAIAGIAIDVQERYEARQLVERERLRAFQNAKLAAIGEMASGIAHEINNPLAIIAGSLALAQLGLEKDSIDREDISFHLNKAVETSHRISEIIRGLSAMSREGEDTALIDSDVVSVVNDVTSLCVQKLKAQDIELSVSQPETVMVRCRPVQIGQVLLNLLNNAIYAVSAANRRNIAIELDDDDTEVRIAVRDSGHGVPIELREKIFEPFFSTRPIGSGSGLGLSISAAIAQSHGGQLVLKAAEPMTCFELSLPKQVRAKP